MIKYIFKTQSDSETRRLTKFIESFEPKVNFATEQGHFGLEIITKFKSEDEKNNFIQCLNSSLNLSEDGTFLK